MEPTAARIERQFADRDAHAIGPLIAQSKDALAIRHDDGLDLVEAGRRQNLLDAALVRQTQEQAAWLSEQSAELLAAGADSGGVDDRQQFFEILAEQREEQGFVAVLQIAQEGIALEIGFEAAQRLEPSRYLFVERSDVGRQE